MQVISNEKVIFFDVDDTLVLWEAASDHRRDLYKYIQITDPHDQKTVLVRQHDPHIKLLKNHHARGSTVVVWSQGGYAWAEAVVKALELETFVHLVLSKPSSYVDDLPISDWLKDRVYIKPDSPWGLSHHHKERPDGI